MYKPQLKQPGAFPFPKFFSVARYVDHLHKQEKTRLKKQGYNPQKKFRVYLDSICSYSHPIQTLASSHGRNLLTCYRHNLYKKLQLYIQCANYLKIYDLTEPQIVRQLY